MQFGHVLNQQAAKTAFVHMVRSGRVPHALMLRGAPGIGKLAFAWAAAQYLNCQQPGETDACGTCPSCRKTAQLVHPDVHVVAPIFAQTTAGKSLVTDDLIETLRPLLVENPYLSLGGWTAALEAENKQLAISVAEIRELKRKLQLKAFEGGKKIVLLWHAEKMRPEAANALLKLLEEPPDDTVLLLTVEEPAQLLPTIVSRCQLLRLLPLPAGEIAAHLVAQGTDELLARETARLAEGSLAEAQALLQHAADSYAPQYQQWMRWCYEGNFSKLLAWADETAHQPKETQKVFLQYALAQMRDAVLLQSHVPQLVHLPEAELQFLRRFSQALSLEGVMGAVDKLETALFHIGRNANGLLTLLNLSVDLHVLLRGRQAA